MDAETLVKKGYKEAAFRNKSNAKKFAAGWKKKGYTVGYLKSSGPVVEGGYGKNAYYVMATTKKKSVERKKKRVIRRGGSLFGSGGGFVPKLRW